VHHNVIADPVANSIFSFLWSETLILLILRGDLDMFVLHSKIRGHTYFSTDRASGPFKVEYGKASIYSVDDIAAIARQTFDSVVLPFFFHPDWLKPFFLHIPTFGAHMVYATANDVRDDLLFVKANTADYEDPKPFPVFKTERNIQDQEPFQLRPEVQYELFLQRQFVPEQYWYLYPEVQKPSKCSKDFQIEELELEEIQAKNEKLEIEQQRKAAIDAELSFVSVNCASSRAAYVLEEILKTSNQPRAELVASIASILLQTRQAHSRITVEITSSRSQGQRTN